MYRRGLHTRTHTHTQAWCRYRNNSPRLAVHRKGKEPKKMHSICDSFSICLLISILPFAQPWLCLYCCLSPNSAFISWLYFHPLVVCMLYSLNKPFLFLRFHLPDFHLLRKEFAASSCTTVKTFTGTCWAKVHKTAFHCLDLP